MTFHLNTKRNEGLTHPTIWVNLKTIMLSGRSQTPKPVYYVTPFIGNVRTGNSIETESKVVVAWGLRREGKG